MIPDPDYSESESQEDSDEEESEENEDESEQSSCSERLQIIEEDFKKNTTARSLNDEDRTGETFLMDSRNRRLRSTQSQTTEEVLIKPKKPANPYLESMERKKLHKELVFKQKHGQNTMNQRSELQKALEKYSESKVKKDLASSRRSSLEKILERQARKIEMQEREGILDLPPSWIDRLKQQHVTKRTDATKDEFFRVHAKVVGNSMHSHSTDEESNHSSESMTFTKIDSSLTDGDD